MKDLKYIVLGGTLMSGFHGFGPFDCYDAASIWRDKQNEESVASSENSCEGQVVFYSIVSFDGVPEDKGCKSCGK